MDCSPSGTKDNTTLIVRASERFLKETFLPTYDRMCDTLYEHLDAVTERVVADVLHADKSEAAVVTQPKQLDVFAPDPNSKP
jgi:hypothetical protein